MGPGPLSGACVGAQGASHSFTVGASAVDKGESLSFIIKFIYVGFSLILLKTVTLQEEKYPPTKAGENTAPGAVRHK